ncbi:hypothetical protein M5D96_004439 [Drosophila gunungcola]|uniref:Uncharacterized protein n=1 Tax=Drosophila gunungcola TaxID=103775 RepID=A0A9P9YU14_9MUSC|nr:hypothetical protein M5D96_004439 [Drosophila gunungcola]
MQNNLYKIINFMAQEKWKENKTRHRYVRMAMSMEKIMIKNKSGQQIQVQAKSRLYAKNYHCNSAKMQNEPTTPRDGTEEAVQMFWLCSKINTAVFNFHAFPCGVLGVGCNCDGSAAAESSMVPKAAMATKIKAINMTHTPTAVAEILAQPKSKYLCISS